MAANDNNGHQFKRPRMRRSFRTWIRTAIQNWPLLVWVAILGLVVWLYQHSEHYGYLTGAIESQIQQIAPVETARLLSVDVVTGQKVKAGDIVARMDTTLLDASIAADEAQAVETEERLLGSQEAALRLARQLEASLADAEADYATERQRQLESAAELQALKTDYARRKELLAKHLIREEDATALLPQIAALEQTAETFPELLAIYKRRVDESRRELDNMRQWMQVGKDEVSYQAAGKRREMWLSVLESARRQRKLQRESYTLRATADGEVSRLLFEPGDVVPAGSPVVRVVNSGSEFVEGFLLEGHPVSVVVGQPVRVWRGTDRRTLVPAVVSSVSAEVETFPGRVSPIRGQVLRGRLLMIRLMAPHDFIPGETVQVELVRPGVVEFLKGFFTSRDGSPVAPPQTSPR